MTDRHEPHHRVTRRAFLTSAGLAAASPLLRAQPGRSNIERSPFALPESGVAPPCSSGRVRI